MTTKIHKIKQLLLTSAAITACLLATATVTLIRPAVVAAATTGTFALSCVSGGAVKVSKTSVSCASGPDVVTVQGIGSAKTAKENKTPYPTTTDLTVVNLDCGTSSPQPLQLGDTITALKCTKGTPKSIKVTGYIKANPKASPEVVPYGVNTQTGATIGGGSKAGTTSKALDTNCAPTSGNCADCQNVVNGKAPTGCPGCENGVCQDAAAKPGAVCDKASGCDLIAKYVNPLINVLSVSFGIIAVISLIIAGIQYSASSGDPQAVSKAKDRILKTVFAIIAYFFLYSLLQFLVPGGVFNRPT